MAKKRSADKASQIDLEEALKELEALIEHMEEGDITLEESLKCFERGTQLARSCQEALKAAEQKVQILLEKNGQEELEDFTAAEED
ncbi:MAG TPA: exodeoxyribonuclease VII small subunit [Gammaproteobacteria bacterium]|nr:exodeoxyribonuclease VII small subunit [Gammaproteobacteria bacterium]